MGWDEMEDLVVENAKARCKNAKIMSSVLEVCTNLFQTSTGLPDPTYGTQSRGQLILARLFGILDSNTRNLIGPATYSLVRSSEGRVTRSVLIGQ